MKIKELIKPIEELAPLSYQESYDNAGLLVGSFSDEVESALICLDITEEVIDEAIEKGTGIVICHHPIVFGGLKRFNGNNLVERCVIKAIKNDIAIYAAHTNLDAVEGGVSTRLAQKIGLENVKMLQTKRGELQKLVTYVPTEHSQAVKDALFSAGAGTIGEYDRCSFSVSGTGSFRATGDAKPYVGEVGTVHLEQEERVEVVVPKVLSGKVVSALLSAHPYEEVAYDLFALENKYSKVGIGAVGTLPEAIDEEEYLKKIKSILGGGCIRHSALRGKKVKKVALCGGSGAFLIKTALGVGADLYVTGDVKYHDFFLAEGKMVIADVGHYESEQFTSEIFRDILTKNFPTFALHLSEHSKNPIQYL